MSNTPPVLSSLYMEFLTSTHKQRAWIYSCRSSKQTGLQYSPDLFAPDCTAMHFPSHLPTRTRSSDIMVTEPTES